MVNGNLATVKHISISHLISSHSLSTQTGSFDDRSCCLPPHTRDMQVLTSDAWPKEGWSSVEVEVFTGSHARCTHSTLAYHSLHSLHQLHIYIDTAIEGLLDEILRSLRSRQFPSARAHSLSIHSRTLSYLPQSDCACLHLHRT